MTGSRLFYFAYLILFYLRLSFQSLFSFKVNLTDHLKFTVVVPFGRPTVPDVWYKSFYNPSSVRFYSERYIFVLTTECYLYLEMNVSLRHYLWFFATIFLMNFVQVINLLN